MMGKFRPPLATPKAGLTPPKEGNFADLVAYSADKVAHSPTAEGCRPSGGVVISRNTQNYMSLPFNPKLKERARRLRKAGNLAEVLFWNKVKNKQFKNFDFDRQKIIGNYIADFYCSNCNAVIEIDGSSHNNKKEYDAARDAYLKRLGLIVIHFTDKEVKDNIKAVMDRLDKLLNGEYKNVMINGIDERSEKRARELKIGRNGSEKK